MDAVITTGTTSSGLVCDSISAVRLSKQVVNPPVLDWLASFEPQANRQDVWVYQGKDACRIPQEILSFEASSALTPTLLSVFAALLYRYSYQSEFELQHLKLPSSGSKASQGEMSSVIQFIEHAELSIEVLSTAVEGLLEQASESNQQGLQKDAGFCLVDASQIELDVMEDLFTLFEERSGVIWPVVKKAGEDFAIEWFCSGAVTEEAVERLQTHMLNLVRNAKMNPGLPHSGHAILSEVEVTEQLGFSMGASAEVAETPVYKTVEDQARNHPNKIAVKFDGKQFTYAEINHQANSLAHHLIENGSKIGDKVAVLIKPSENILVALFAVHKSGGTYVPIDPTFPEARINIILQEIAPSAVLIDNNGAVDFDLAVQNLINIDVQNLNDSVYENPGLPVSVDDFSHVFFTSGTTGKPKGTLATHANLIHYISAAQSCYRFNQDDVFISAARCTFSISLFELITPLYVGASLNILPRELVLDMGRLAKEVSESSFFHFGPSLLKQLLPYIEENYQSYEAFDGLRHVSSGGDMVPPEVLEQLKKIFRKAEVFVIYGSSEISCMGCTYEALRDKTVEQTLVGKPHQNVGVRIVDKKGHMVPVGVAGRVQFTGGGVVSGYLNMPELTEERFPNIDGERFYDMGDIGRFDVKGNIQLLGREDFQVQLRGMRIELLEIETCLKSHPSVRDCVLVAKALKNQEDKSLIAYLALDKDGATKASELIEFANQQLPDYMVPAVFVRLEKLPLNHNGKLDRSQLPEPTVENMLVSAAFESASSDIEQELIYMWERLFGIEGIGVDHDFFELGGDSLLAVNFLIEIDKRFEKFIPISILMHASTIRDIAAIVASDELVEGVGDVVVLRKGNSEPPLFCLYGVLLYKDLAESLDTERMVCGVFLEEEVNAMGANVDQETLKTLSTVEGIASRYLASIRAFQQTGPYYLCGESFGGIIALEVARQLEAGGEEVKLIAMLDSVAPGFYESLSKFNRVFVHLKQLRLHGFSYIKKKIQKKAAGRDSGYQDVEIIEDGRGAIRDSASKKYNPETYEGQVTLFRATKRSEFEPKQKDLGWSRFIREVEVLDVEGTHLGILQKGKVEKLAAQIKERID